MLQQDQDRRDNLIIIQYPFVLWAMNRYMRNDTSDASIDQGVISKHMIAAFQSVSQVEKLLRHI